MALPTITFDSVAGSDTLASGAGPTTAITGSAGVSASTTITLDGSPDLSGVATDGSAVIFFNDSTAGNRNFDKITAVDNSLKTVTVATGFTAGTKAWAIGGYRKTALGSLRIWNNNAGSGDWAPGWSISLGTATNAFTETVSSSTTFTFRRAGDASVGLYQIYSNPSAPARAKITVDTNSVTAMGTSTTTYIKVKGIDFECTAATKTNCVVWSPGGSGCWILEDLRANHSTNHFGHGVDGMGNLTQCISCDMSYMTSTGYTGTLVSAFMDNCKGNNNGTYGVSYTGSSTRPNWVINNCQFDSNTTAGAGMLGTGTADANNGSFTIRGCRIRSNTGDGILCNSSSTNLAGLQRALIINNDITSNGGYPVNFSGGSITAAMLLGNLVRVDYNNFGVSGGAGGNTSGSGDMFPTGVATNTLNVDPAGTGVNSAGFPQQNVGGNGGTVRNYMDVGLQNLISGTSVPIPYCA